MDKLKKKKLKRLIALGVAVVVVVLLAVMPLIAKNNEKADGPQASILSGKVTVGAVDSKIIGGGTLSGDDAMEIVVPEGVKLTKFLVSNGDTVQMGDALAAVDRVTVMTAITQVQETMDDLSKEIEKERDETTDGKVTALAGGKVKAIYAKKGDLVQDVMLQYGTLAVLSLDGLMAVDMSATSNLSAGDKVTVTLSNRKKVTGEVETNLSGEMTVTVEDNNYPIGEKVTVSGTDGAEIGSGELYVYSAWNATAYSGTVSAVKAKEGNQLGVGDTLLQLTDTGHTATYYQLVGLRQEYEEMMLELFQMYQTEQLVAPCDGVVSGIDKNSTQLLAGKNAEYSLDMLANAPNGDDTVTYTNFIGKVVALAENGWAVQINPQPVNVVDYKVLEGVDKDSQKMKKLVIYNPNGQGGQIPMYELVNGMWIQGNLNTVSAGDVMLFAGLDESNMVWTVRMDKAATEQEKPGNPSVEGNMPEQGTTGETPGSQSQDRPQTNYPSGDFGDMGSFPQSGGNTQQNETVQRYSLTVAEVMIVTPQSEMTLDITVDEQDMSVLQVGMAAQVKIDALGGEKCDATITSIGNIGSSNGGSSKFTVTLTMDRTENMLAGMNATASVVLSTKDDVVTIPVEALVEQDGQTLVYTGYDEKKEELKNPVVVKTGVSDGKTVEILEGLSVGEGYYYAYYDTLEISDAPEFGGGMGGFGGFGR